MCGIAAYCGQDKAGPFIVEALKRLEYRGYDSWGMALQCKDNLALTVKKTGSISDAYIDWRMPMGTATVGIGHTRWATHGEVSERNAHPIAGGCLHSSTCLVVHNGIIENHELLRQALKDKGYEFKTETDTEVIAHLFDCHLKYHDNDLAKAVQLLMLKLVGQYAVVIMPVAQPGKLVLACKGSPLLLTSEGYIASDQAAFAGYSNYFYRMHEDEWRIVDASSRNFDVSSDETRTSYPLWPVLAKAEQEKGSEPHFMLKEIKEQPKVLAQEHCGIDFKMNPSRVVLFGCGSSYHAAMLGKVYFERYASVPTEVEYACELQDRNMDLYPKDTLFIALTQSGETKDTVAAMQAVRKHFPVDQVMLITNSETCSAMHWARHLIMLDAGVERGVAATKTFTSQVASLLHTAVYLKQCKWVGSFLKNVLGGELPCKVQGIIERLGDIKAFGKFCSEFSNILYLGRGWNYPVALEGALKMKEVAYIHAEAIHAGEMKHGPIALIDDKTLSIFLVTRDCFSQNRRILSNMQEIKARNGKILAVVQEGLEGDVINLADRMFVMPQCGEAVQPILTSVVLQCLAYHAAVELGRNVDKPRNLAKSVTVE